MLFRKTLSSKPYTPPPQPVFNLGLIDNTYDKTPTGLTVTANLVRGIVTAGWRAIRASNAAKRTGKWKFEFTCTQDGALIQDELFVALDNGASDIGGDGFDFSKAYIYEIRGGEVRSYAPSSFIAGKATFLNNQRCVFVIDLDSPTKTFKLYNGTTLIHTFNLATNAGIWAPLFAINSNGQQIQIHSDITINVETDAERWSDITTSLFKFQGPSGVNKHNTMRAMANHIYSYTSGAWVMCRAINYGKSTGKWAFEFTPRSVAGYVAGYSVIGIVTSGGNFSTSLVPHDTIPSCYVSGANAFVNMPGKTLTVVNPSISEGTRCAFVLDLVSPTKTLKFYVGSTLIFTQEVTNDTWYPIAGFFTSNNMYEIHTDLILGVEDGASIWS